LFTSTTVPAPTRIYSLSLHDALPIYGWPMTKSCEYLAAILLIAMLLSGCGAPPQGMPPYLALVTPRIPDTIGQCTGIIVGPRERSEEHTSELQSRENLVCRLLLEKKK